MKKVSEHAVTKQMNSLGKVNNGGKDMKTRHCEAVWGAIYSSD